MLLINLYKLYFDCRNNSTLNKNSLILAFLDHITELIFKYNSKFMPFYA